MLPQEQKIAFGLAAGAAVAFGAIWQPWLGGNHLTGFLLGLAFCASLTIVARQGHRLWTAFASFLIGLFGPWPAPSGTTPTYILGVFYVAFAFWLGWRAHRSLKATLNAEPTAVRATPIPPKRQTAITSKRVTPKGTRSRRSPKRS